MNKCYDVIVIGAGHAGCEAALASARMGCNTLLLTMNNDRIAYMSCNPAIGGQAKGQLAREVDALGGEMGINTDKSALQYKRLNSSKGPAVRSSRAQCDKVFYSLRMKETLENEPNLIVTQREVKGLRVENGKVKGVFTNYSEEISAKTIIITAGTFMKSMMYCGDSRMEGGRSGDSSASAISTALLELGFRLQRLKTGTPARLHRNSIDFSALTREDGDKNPVPFSFYTIPDPFPHLQQLPCYLTYTNTRTHELIAEAKHRSPMFTGAITGKGPRYCPSIEDKVFRFPDKDRHQIFLEPESLFSHEIYANGLSTSLPLEVQTAFLRTISGLENVEISRPGYAVEYDAINPVVLRHTLESKDIDGLFFAGQVNGTSGYEEAAAQGLVAGANAALKVLGKEEFILGRDEAYIGVLVDDLVTKGCEEPYRMFTSRAEFRLILREDTADFRLAEKGNKIGLLGEKKFSLFSKKLNDYSKISVVSRESYLYPRDFQENPSKFENLGIASIRDRISVYDLLKRPEINFSVLNESGILEQKQISLSFESASWVHPFIYEALEIESKYSGYISRELEMIAKVKKQELRKIPDYFDYTMVNGLSSEVVEKLKSARPESLGQALRVPGITPAAIALVLVHLEKSGFSGRKENPPAFIGAQ